MAVSSRATRVRTDDAGERVVPRGDGRHDAERLLADAGGQGSVALSFQKTATESASESGANPRSLKMVGGVKQSTCCMARRKPMITMGSPYFVRINANEIIPSWYLLGAVCVWPRPPLKMPSRKRRAHRAAHLADVAGVVLGALHRRVLQSPWASL
jgi:hypothetical protein